MTWWPFVSDFSALTLFFEGLVCFSLTRVQEQVEETYIMIKPDGVQRGLVSFPSSFRIPLIMESCLLCGAYSILNVEVEFSLSPPQGMKWGLCMYGVHVT